MAKAEATKTTGGAPVYVDDTANSGMTEGLTIKEPKSEPLVPLTAEEVTAKVEQIVTRVKEVGLRAPLRALFTTYAKQVTSVLDGVLGALDGDYGSKKKG